MLRETKDGAVFTGAGPDLEANVRALTTDWKRTAVLAAVAIGMILVLIVLSKLLFRLWVLILCIVAGGAAAYYLSPYVDQILQSYLSPDVRTDLIAYAAAFLGGYIVAALIIGILRKLARV
jgi:uncharacterized membrane protein required for colicin V production